MNLVQEITAAYAELDRLEARRQALLADRHDARDCAGFILRATVAETYDRLAAECARVSAKR